MSKGKDSLKAILRDRRTDLRARTEGAWDAIDDENKRLIMLVKTLEREYDELQTTFNLRWDADMRAIKEWQAATGRDLEWPDHADLCIFLLEQVREFREKLESLSAHCASESRYWDGVAQNRETETLIAEKAKSLSAAYRQMGNRATLKSTEGE